MNYAEQEMWGLIPSFLDPEDPAKAAQQFDAKYSFGGGWRPFKGHKFDAETLTLKYPGDPALKAISMIQFRDEKIFLFDYAWVVILQPDGTWESCRMD